VNIIEVVSVLSVLVLFISFVILLLGETVHFNCEKYKHTLVRMV